MNLEIAAPHHSAELVKFYKEFPSQGLVEFRLDRRDDYFGLYKLHSEDYRTYVLRDEDGKIQAAASFVFRDVYQDGRPQKIAMATDLRVAPHRRAVLQWSQHFLPVMQEVSESFKCSHFFSTINMTEAGGLNAFVRPRTMKRPLPRYYLYRKFDLVTLHGRFPWAAKPLKHVSIRPGSAQNLEGLLAYVLKRSQYRSFANVWDMESLQKRISRLKNFDLSHFKVAFDSQQNIIGCVAPWSPEGLQDWIPQSYTLQAHNFRQFLKFGSPLGWTRPLSKPVRSTGFETPLKFRYLTHVHVDNEDVFASLIHSAYESATTQEFLCYAHCDQDIRLRPPEHWIAARIPHALYTVVAPETPPPTFLHPSISQNPDIEAHLI